jgi:hypothetical protein
MHAGMNSASSSPDIVLHTGGVVDANAKYLDQATIGGNVAAPASR